MNTRYFGQSTLLGITCLAVLLSTAACGEKKAAEGTAPKTEAASTVKEGWTEIASSGFKVSLPKGWNAIDLTAGDLDKVMDAAMAASPGAKSMEAQIRAAASSGMIKVMALHPKDGETDFVENMNVVVTDLPSGVTLKQIEEAYRSQVGAMSVPGSEIKGDPVDLPVGKAMRMQTKLNMQSGANKYVASLAYMFAEGGKSYTVTFSSKPDRETAIIAEADEIMSTFKIG
ncbi:MAG TPA: hypothetical protein PLX06_04365 [Fimbriimonadaceae bacterium]|nr:hypothetical protein [Fimbriimonadaceae bacterium]